MTQKDGPAPVLYPGVMVSSTARGLQQHRDVLARAIDRQQLKALAFEQDTAKPGVDVLDSSLKMVSKATAYIAIISHCYGQIPDSPARNPHALSLTELEFDEALRLDRPIVLFIMGRKHPVMVNDVDQDPIALTKLNKFREKAKRMSSSNRVHRVYKEFEEFHEFEVRATEAVAELRHFLDAGAAPPSAPPPRANRELIPRAPAFYAEPPYVGSHAFVGRAAQLETLSEWAGASDPNPILLFEAIGGSGKSLLTWHWLNEHAPRIRTDWPGRFWYSFYEKGAVMQDFCRRALAYMTGEPLRAFAGRHTQELQRDLVTELRSRPWLLVLDGLERILVSYHRFDAAQMRDEEAGISDAIVHRDPRDSICPEDDELLRALAGATPSKLLLTTRLTPRALLNAGGLSIPGVRRELLPGLRPVDAEKLLLSCGVRGDSGAIQDYLKQHCDCHPLTTGILGGIVANYLPARGNFDIWSTAPDGGSALNLAELDLVQKRNHILRAALEALSPKSRRVLSTLALFTAGVDYQTLSALDAHLDAPGITSRSSSPAPSAPPARPVSLPEAVLDLEHRGLLQYDRQSDRYDLHPVVRGIASGGLDQGEKDAYRQVVVDHFSNRHHDPYENATSIDDLSAPLTLIRILLQLGYHQEAFSAYEGSLRDTLRLYLWAAHEVLSLLRPFFRGGLKVLPDTVNRATATKVAEDFSGALFGIEQNTDALELMNVVIPAYIGRAEWWPVANSVGNISMVLDDHGRVAAALRTVTLALELAEILRSHVDVFRQLIFRFSVLSEVGRWAEADADWRRIEAMGRDWPRDLYAPGRAEVAYSESALYRGDLDEEHLLRAERLTKAGRSWIWNHNVLRVRARWQMMTANWGAAERTFRQVLEEGRRHGLSEGFAEVGLGYALAQQGSPPDLQRIESLPTRAGGAEVWLARLWLLVGERDRAETQALLAYANAWQEGEPFVYRSRLIEAEKLLNELGVGIPTLPPYDSANDPPLPWEQDVSSAIDRMRSA